MSNKERSRGERKHSKFPCDDGPPRLRQRPFRKALDRARPTRMEPDEDFIEAALVVGDRESVSAHERHRFESKTAAVVGELKGLRATLATTHEERTRYIAKLEAKNADGEPSGSWPGFAITKITCAALAALGFLAMGLSMFATVLERIGIVDSFLQGLSVSAVTLVGSLVLKVIAVTLEWPHNRKRYLRALCITSFCACLPYFAILARLYAMAEGAGGSGDDPYGEYGDVTAVDTSVALEGTLRFFMVFFGVVAEVTGASAAFEWVELLYREHGDASGHKGRARLIHRHKRERAWETAMLSELAGALHAFDSALRVVIDRALAIYNPKAAETEVLAFRVTELRENRLAARAATPPSDLGNRKGSDTNFLTNGASE